MQGNVRRRGTGAAQWVAHSCWLPASSMSTGDDLAFADVVRQISADLQTRPRAPSAFARRGCEPVNRGKLRRDHATSPKHGGVDGVGICPRLSRDANHVRHYRRRGSASEAPRKKSAIGLSTSANAFDSIEPLHRRRDRRSACLRRTRVQARASRRPAQRDSVPSPSVMRRRSQHRARPPTGLHERS